MAGTGLRVICPGMEEGGRFPLRHTGRGEDLSPEFLLRDLSPKAQALAVILEDLSHPIPHFPHWVVWNLPAGDRIPGGIPPGAEVPGMESVRQGIAYGFHRYAGPKPPKGKRHTYRFTVYALDVRLQLSPMAGRRTFLKRAAGHILQQGSLTGVFE